LSFGIGGSESTIPCRRQFEISDLSSSVCRSLVKRIYVIDVDMDHRGRECAECPWAGEAFARLAEHDQSVVAEQKLVVCAARGARLRKAKLETEAFLKVLDGCCRVFVQEVWRDTRIPRRCVRHVVEYDLSAVSGPRGLRRRLGQRSGMSLDGMGSALRFDASRGSKPTVNRAGELVRRQDFVDLTGQ
jgi:hypothetical protein